MGVKTQQEGVDRKLGCFSEKIIIDGQYLSSHQLGTILRLLTMFKQTPIYHHSVSILHLFFCEHANWHIQRRRREGPIWGLLRAL